MNINKIIARLEEPGESVVMPDDAWNVLCEAVKRGDRKLGEGIMCFVYSLGVKECVKRVKAMEVLQSQTNVKGEARASQNSTPRVCRGA